MRIAHGQRREPELAAPRGRFPPERLVALAPGREPGRVEGDLRRLEAGPPHVHGDPAVGRERQAQHPAQGLYADRVAGRQALVPHEAQETARAIAAMLDLAAVGIEDPVAEVDIGPARTLDEQQLVRADAEMAIGETAPLR